MNEAAVDDQMTYGRMMELRELCDQLNTGQRALARRLELDEDDFRHMCSGHRAVTLTVLYAVRYLRGAQ